MIEDSHGVNPTKRHPIKYNISSQVATLLNEKRDIGSLVESERRSLCRSRFWRGSCIEESLTPQKLNTSEAGIPDKLLITWIEVKSIKGGSKPGGN